MGKTFRFSLRTDHKHGDNYVLVRVVSCPHPVHCPRELLVPVIIRRKNGEEYFVMDFEHSKDIDGRDYGEEYKARTGQKEIFSLLEQEAQSVLRKILESSVCGDRKVVVKT